ncbi:MAG TPA: hypothetical protein PKB06_07390 [Actinotalea sp.]|nr:hypothetical protein [Actinotalea sp.]
MRDLGPLLTRLMTSAQPPGRPVDPDRAHAIAARRRTRPHRHATADPDLGAATPAVRAGRPRHRLTLGALWARLRLQHG